MALILTTITGPNGIGKSEQAPLLSRRLTEAGYPVRHVETRDLIKARLPFNSDLEVDKLSDGTLINLIKEEERYRTGQFATPKWVVELLRREMNAAINEGEGCVFSGSPRTVAEAWGLYATYMGMRQNQSRNLRLDRFVIVRLRFPWDESESQRLGYPREDFSIARARILGGATVIDESDQYKVDSFDLRRTWYLEHTLPAFEFLEYAPNLPVPIEVVDDGYSTIEQVHEKIWSSVIDTL